MYGWRNNGGLGTAAPTNVYVQTAPPANPTVSDCAYDCTTFWNWLIHPCCVDASPNWEGNFITGSNPYQGLPETPPPIAPLSPVATASNPNPLITPPASASAAQETVDATIAATTAANQAQAQSFFADLNTSIQNQNPSGCSSTIAPSFGVCDSTIYWVGGILAASLLLFGSMGRGH